MIRFSCFPAAMIAYNRDAVGNAAALGATRAKKKQKNVCGWAAGSADSEIAQ